MTEVLSKEGRILHEFARTGVLTEEVTQVLKSNQHINEQNEKGETPLHIAVQYGTHLDVISTLLKHGASRKIKDHMGQTPVSVAIAKNFEEAEDLLLRFDKRQYQDMQRQAQYLSETREVVNCLEKKQKSTSFWLKIVGAISLFASGACLIGTLTAIALWARNRMAKKNIKT